MGYKCPGSSYGNCCSSSGYVIPLYHTSVLILTNMRTRFCGVTGVHCGTGCQANFGDCFITYLPSSDMPSYGKVSTDGKCGGSAAVTCAGSSFGNCCSSTGSCGTSVNHCAQGWFVLPLIMCLMKELMLTTPQSRILLERVSYVKCTIIKWRLWHDQGRIYLRERPIQWAMLFARWFLRNYRRSLQIWLVRILSSQQFVHTNLRT